MTTQKKTDNAWVERRKVGMLIPPPILLVLLIATSTKIHLMIWGAFSVSPLTAIAGTLLMLLGLTLTTVCIRLFRAKDTPVRPTRPVTTVVINGPYAYSRNPIYLGMLLCLSGASVLLNSPVFALAVFLFWLTVHFGAVLPEERYLLRTQGDAYRQYQQRVRRWL